MGAADVHRLAQWLTERGYLPQSDRPPDPERGRTLAHVVAGELESLAVLLRDDRLSPEARAIRFADAVESWHRTLAAYRAALAADREGAG